MDVIANRILDILAVIANTLWSWPLIILIAVVTIWFTINTRAFQFRRFGHIMKNTFGKLTFKSKNGETSPFRACCIALSNTVGSGNIAGVATAIAVGGPGAVFWMWLMALLGMITKMGEISLAIHYRDVDADGTIHGGPMQYMRKGLGWNGMAKIFAVAIIINCFLTTGLVQPNTVANAFQQYYNINPYITAVGMAIITAIVIFGGVRRIGEFCNVVVPVMAVIYVFAGLIVVVLQLGQIPAVFALIFGHAFRPMSAVGGFTGSVVATTIQKGMARGMYSNEAGQGTAPIAHAFANTKHPVEQGMWGAFEVFVDTIVVCSITAIIVLSTGAWQGTESGINMVLAGFDAVLPGSIGGMLLSITIFFFCLSTQIGFAASGVMAVKDLAGDRKWAVNLFKFAYLIPGILFAGVTDMNALMVCADIVTATESIPNLITLLALSGVFFKLMKDYESGEYRYATAIVDKSKRYIKEGKGYAAQVEKQARKSETTN